MPAGFIFSLSARWNADGRIVGAFNAISETTQQPAVRAPIPLTSHQLLARPR
jgi:hypothetical protein